MTDTEIDNVAQQEEDAYKALAGRAKFKQQLSYGVGAAMVFGLVSAMAGLLIKVAFPSAPTVIVASGGGQLLAAASAAAAGVSIPAVLGLAALGVVGVGLLYLSAKFLSENTVLDQQLQAKQISVATRGKTPAVEPIIAPKVEQFPDAVEAKTDSVAETMTPTTMVGNERELADTITPRGETKAASTDISTDTNWATKVSANDNKQLGMAV